LKFYEDRSVIGGKVWGGEGGTFPKGEDKGMLPSGRGKAMSTERLRGNGESVSGRAIDGGGGRFPLLECPGGEPRARA